jgi:hypothetical protein
VIAAHVHQALRQVKELRLRVLNAGRFTGYSGRAHAFAGSVAFLAAVVMSASWYPRTVEAHLIGWGTVFGIAVFANYAAVVYWFLFQPDVKRDIRRLVPAVDAIPSLLVGGILTAALLRSGQYDLLFGTWMCLYGLAHISSRRVLPRAISHLGTFYVACGVLCFFLPALTFTNPWPMGLVFGVGEVTGGMIFHRNRVPEASGAGVVTEGGPPVEQEI